MFYGMDREYLLWRNSTYKDSIRREREIFEIGAIACFREGAEQRGALRAEVEVNGLRRGGEVQRDQGTLTIFRSTGPGKDIVVIRVYQREIAIPEGRIFLAQP